MVAKYRRGNRVKCVKAPCIKTEYLLGAVGTVLDTGSYVSVKFDNLDARQKFDGTTDVGFYLMDESELEAVKK